MTAAKDSWGNLAKIYAGVEISYKDGSTTVSSVRKTLMGGAGSVTSWPEGANPISMIPPLNRFRLMSVWVMSLAKRGS